MRTKDDNEGRRPGTALRSVEKQHSELGTVKFDVPYFGLSKMNPVETTGLGDLLIRKGIP